MSGSITFPHGPFRHWQVRLDSRWDGGQPSRVQVQIVPPGEDWPGNLLTFTLRTDGWEQVAAADRDGGPAALAELLEWIINATAAKLDNSDVARPSREYWQNVVDAADRSRAEFRARYPDGRVPGFEVVAELVYDERVGALLGALPEQFGPLVVDVDSCGENVYGS
jgi:hypothetical protein